MGFAGASTPMQATPNKLERRMGKDGNMYWFCDSCDFVKKRWSRAKRHEGRCPTLRARILAETPHKPKPPAPDTPAQSGRKKLARALRRAAAEQRDPWVGEQMARLSTERVIKHKYDPSSHRWRDGPALVKCQRRPFAEGAMRECYRLKKLSQQPHRALSVDWTHASNYVAKRYKKEVDRGVYFDDVKMQVRGRAGAGAARGHSTHRVAADGRALLGRGV